MEITASAADLTFLIGMKDVLIHQAAQREQVLTAEVARLKKELAERDTAAIKQNGKASGEKPAVLAETLKGV